MDTGQIKTNSERGQLIKKIITEKNLENIVEIGTWKGGGTTTIIAESIRDNCKFITLETNFENFSQAQKNLSSFGNKIELIHGRIVELEDSLFFFNSLNLNDDVDVTSSQHVSRFLQDFKNLLSTENVLNNLPKNIDFLILDGGEYTTYSEWKILEERTKIIAINDTKMTKSKKIYNELSKNPNYELIQKIDYEGNGFAVFEKIDVYKKQEPIKLNDYKNVIITATNSPYFDSLLTMISSVHKFGFDLVDRIVVFDIGLSEAEIKKLESLSKVEIYEFSKLEIEQHDEFIVGKSHVYKNYCLKVASDFGQNILWIDSGASFINKIDSIFSKIDEDEIFLVGDVHLNRNYTHKECIEIMQATEDELNSKQLWSGLVGFKSYGKYQKLIDESSHYTLIPNCCNGNHENHRHDQSILSILSKRYNCPTNDIDIYGYWTDMQRNLHTALSINSVVFAHRRGHMDTSSLIFKEHDNQEGITISQPVVQNIIDEKPKKTIIKFSDENLVGQDGLSRYISPNSNWIRNNDETNYDACIFTDRFATIKEQDLDKINYAWLIEPPIINGENYSNIISKSGNFKKVFSHNISLRDKINNFHFIPHGGTWLRNEDIGLHNKNKNISFIYSDKQWILGHKLRHRFADIIKEKNIDVDLYGSGSPNKIDYKITGLKDYRFSIVIENSVSDDYFTEKLIDCFLTGTIPIYFGTKNVTNYFDENGIIFLPKITEYDFDMDGATELIKSLDEELYQSKIISVMNNFNKAQTYAHPEKIINEVIEKDFEK